MSAHTPGPWEAIKPDSVGGYRVYTAGKGYTLIATLGYVRDSAQEAANARLIAAAPDLLAALIKLSEATDPIGWDLRMELARAAIAKAEGRQS